MRCAPRKKKALQLEAKRRKLTLTELLLTSAEFVIRPTQKLKDKLAVKDPEQPELPNLDDDRQLEMFAAPKAVAS